METFTAIREELSAEKMLETVNQVAKWERLSGSQEEMEAFHYLERRLQEYGYQTQLLACDAYISLPGACTLKAGGESVHAQTHSMVPTASAAGEMVYCRNAKEMGEKDCRGKIVLTTGRAVFPPVQAAQTAGAVGVVFIQEAVIRECIPSGCWGSPTTADENMLPKIPVASILDDVGNVLRDRLLAGETIPAELTTETDTSWRKIPLLIGEIKAPVATERFVQFTGHVDSWYYGAVDNGSSNSLQLEVARIAMAHRAELRRNFRIVYFSGHSHGRYAGSAWYADYFWEDLHDNCVININTDCAGGKGAEDIVHSIIMPETKDLAVQIVKEQTGETFEGVRCGRLGDQSFWNVGLSNAFASFSRQKKIRLPNGSMGYERGNAELGPGWHTPADTLDKIDPANLLRDGKIVGEYVMTFLTAEVLPLYFSRSAADIGERLAAWAEMAGGEFDLSVPRARAARLGELCRQFEEAELPAEKKNETMLLLSRLLVPLNFTRGNIYGTEPAVSVDPMPSLTPIRRLTAEGTTEKEKRELCLELVRSRNYINHSLALAARLLETVLPG